MKKKSHWVPSYTTLGNIGNDILTCKKYIEHILIFKNQFQKYDNIFKYYHAKLPL